MEEKEMDVFEIVVDYVSDNGIVKREDLFRHVAMELHVPFEKAKDLVLKEFSWDELYELGVM